MIIEIRKAGFLNKGAELMFHAVLQKSRARYPNASFVMAPSTRRGNAPYSYRSQYGLFQKAWLWRGGLQLGDLALLVPEKMRDMYGIVLDAEIDVVLDVAGFSYSDQWGDASLVELDRATRRWKKRGTSVVLMPQAFGPFTSLIGQDALRRSIERVDLVCARDRRSYENVVGICGERPNIVRFPDFTNLISGVSPSEQSIARGGFCLVPNARMIDKVDGASEEAYLELFVSCCRIAKELGETPFVLVHEGRDDARLAEAISAMAGRIPIVREENALAIKGIIGASRASVGSRFHGLVSALSQGVPSLGTGWSHKYKELFDDYACPEALIEVGIPESELRKKVAALFDSSSRSATVALLKREGERLKAESDRLWDKIFGLTDRQGGKRCA